MDAGNFESEDDKDEAVFLVQRASEAITALKAHQLRSINQDRARLEVLASLDSTGVLVEEEKWEKNVHVAPPPHKRFDCR